MFEHERILTDSINKNIFHFGNEENTFIFTLSDLHIGMGNREYIQNIIDFIKKLPNAYVVIGGDIVENAIKNSKGNIIECYAPPQEQISLAVEMLKPIRDKIICMIGSGNHEERTEKEAYISITQIIACMLNIPEKYVKDFAIGYLDVGDNCYIYGNIHKHRKANNYYAYMNVDILVQEHTHELSYREVPVLYHNKYNKKTSVRTNYIVNNGSALCFPSYAKRGGYSMQPIGTYIIGLGAKNRKINIWRDVDLYEALKNGYKF